MNYTGNPIQYNDGFMGLVPDLKGLGAYVCDESGCYDNGVPSYGIPAVDPTSMACTCVMGSCVENQNSCASSGGNPTYSNPQGSNSGLWSAIQQALNSATGILGKRYSVPQLNPGQLIQTGPNGQSLMYQGTAGNMQVPSLSTSSLSSMLPLLLVGGVVLFVVSKK